MRRLLLALIFLAPASWAWAQAGAPANLVLNGDFAQAKDGRPESWTTSGNAKDVEQTLTLGKDEAGRPCAVLACARCDRTGPASHAMLCQIGGAHLVKGRLYEFSCRLREENLRGGSVSVALQDTKGWVQVGLHAEFGVGPAWKPVKTMFVAERDVAETGRLQIWFTEPGTLWVADVRIVEAPKVEAEFTDVVADLGTRNRVFNSSFELGAAGWSSLGEGAGWGDLSRLHGSVQTTGGTHGKSFLRIPLGGADTPVLGFDYYEPVVRREIRPLAASLGWIRVKPGQAYTLSCDMRASRAGIRAALGVRANNPGGWRRDLVTNVTLTAEWKRYSYTFKTDRSWVFVTVGPDLEREEKCWVDIDAVQLESGDRATEYEPRGATEVSLEPSQPGGLFIEGEPASLILKAANYTAQGAKVRLTLGVRDFDDQPVPFPGALIDVGPGATTTQEMKLPASWKGFYRAYATFGSVLTPVVRLAVLPKRASNDGVLGINHAFADSALIRLASKFGVTWYRDWSLKWQHLEPTKGEWHFDLGDAQIDRVLREGPRVMALMPPFPSADWSSEAPAGLPTKGYPGVRLKQAWGPKDPAELAEFIERTVAHVKGRVRVFEFLNEPIYTDYALPSRDETQYGGRKYTPADYVALLDVAAKAMKKADPACLVMGGISGGPDAMTREVISAGCLKHVDIFNLHIYPGARKPEGFIGPMDDLLAFMDKSGGRKPIWMTEFSYYGADDLPMKPFHYSQGVWADARLLDSERQCAQFTVRWFAIMLTHGVEKIFVHSGASGRANDPQFECAFLEYGGAPRKLAPALAVLTELLGPKPAASGFKRLGERGCAAAFEAAGRSVVMLWEEEDGPGAQVSGLPADARRLDMMGRDLPGGAVRLSPSPVYVVAPAGRAKAVFDAVSIGGKP